jgi:hypothetical protein
MEVDYYSKYLKYKSKYLELKKQMGGGKCTGLSFNKDNIECINHYKLTDLTSCNIACKCTEFVLKTDTDTTNICNTCGHLETKHIK